MKPNAINIETVTDKDLNRWIAKVYLTDTCWLWLGSKVGGYGCYYFNGKGIKAHRFSYELFNGKIPEGMVVDHTCKVKACVNPTHLEAVTQRTNILRDDSRGDEERCKYGHSNFRIVSGSRKCYTCANQRLKERYKKDPEYRRKKILRASSIRMSM